MTLLVCRWTNLSAVIQSSHHTTSVHRYSNNFIQMLFLFNFIQYLIMVALWNRADHYIFALWLLLLFFFLA